MKKVFIMVLFMFATSPNAQAGAMTPDQRAIESLIKKMYAIDPETFDYAEFGGEYKNGKEVVKAKHDPDRQCRLLAEFLAKEAVIRNEGINQGCMTGVGGYFRYPGVGDMDLSAATRTSDPEAPHVNTPVVDGDKAKVHVTFSNSAGDDFYYLRKTPEGWRIYKVESRENRNPDHEEGECDDRIEDGDTVNVFPPPPDKYLPSDPTKCRTATCPRMLRQ